MRKNVASQNVSFHAVSTTDGSDVTTGTPTVYYTIDGGTQATGTGTSTHEGNGEWSYVPAQAETNGDHVAFTQVLSGAVSQTVNVWPVSFDPTAADLGLENVSAADVNAQCDTAISDAALATAANLATVDTVVDGIQTDLSNATDGLGALKTLIDTVDTNVDAVLVDTGTTLPATLATIDGIVDSILLDTAEIGTAGAGLTDLGGMSTTMKAQVNTEADTALTDYDPPTNTEMEARTPTAAQLLYMTRHAATAKPVTFTGGTTTTAILGNVDGSAASSTDDVYNSRLLVFNAGTLDEQVCQITDYVGSTTTATISAVTTAVTSSHTAVLV